VEDALQAAVWALDPDGPTVDLYLHLFRQRYGLFSNARHINR